MRTPSEHIYVIYFQESTQFFYFGLLMSLPDPSTRPHARYGGDSDGDYGASGRGAGTDGGGGGGGGGGGLGGGNGAGGGSRRRQQSTTLSERQDVEMS